MTSLGLLLIWIAVAVVALIILLWFFPVTLWFQALISGVRISLIQLVLMLLSTFLHLIRTRCMSVVRTPDILNWIHRVNGKNHSRISWDTTDTALQITKNPND